MPFWKNLSGLYDKKTLDNIYRVATNDRHGFLYIDLMESDKKKMFYKKPQSKNSSGIMLQIYFII